MLQRELVCLNVGSGAEEVEVFTRVFSEGESWSATAVLPVASFGGFDDEQLCDMLGWAYWGGDVGQQYSGAPYVVRGKSRILVRQSGGWDI